MNNEIIKRRTPVVFYISLVLLCLVMISSHMTGGLYARYTTTANGSDSARVAKFDVDSSCVYDNETEKYILTITNNSEVTVSYTLSFIANGAALPDGVTIAFGSTGNSGILVKGSAISEELNFSENYSSYHDELVIETIVTISQVD